MSSPRVPYLVRQTTASLTLLLCVASLVSGQEWTRFRGPNGSGISSTAVPIQWNRDQVAWKTKLPGVGHSSPVVWENHVYLMSGHESSATQYVVAIDRSSGRIQWKREFPIEAYHIHVRNSFASTTPAVDELHVYVAWSTPDETTLAALSHDGEIVWERTFHRSFDSRHGFGASPIVWRDSVILAIMQKKPQDNGPRVQRSNVVCCDRRTGELQWDKQLWSDAVSYSVPCIRESKDSEDELILCSTSHGIFSLNLRTGVENWSVEVFDKRTVSSPVLVGDLIFGSTGSGGGGNYVAVVDAQGEPKLAYEVRKQAPYVPTIVAQDGLAYLWSDKGIVTCIRAESGEKVWQERVGGNYSGSPIIAGDHLYCIDEDGTVTILPTGESPPTMTRIPLGEASRSTPAVSHGLLFLRTYSHLTAVGPTGRQDSAD